MRRNVRAFGWLLVVLCGCHDFLAAYRACVAQGRCADVNPCSGPTFSGRAILHRGLESGTVIEPAARAQLVARVDGGWQSFPAALDGNGGFVVCPAPEGALYVQASGAGPDTWVYTTERSLTLDLYALGRAGARSCDAGTALAASFSGLAPWQGGLDTFGVASPNAGIAWNATADNGWVANRPPPGATSLVQATYGYCPALAPEPLIDGSLGDTATFFELNYLTGIGAATGYLTVGRVAQVTGLVMADGQVTQASGAMTPPPVAGEVVMTHDAPAFQALLPDNPTTAPVIQAAAVLAEPAGVALGPRAASATTLSLTFVLDSGPELVDMPYPDAFPDEGETWAQAGVAYSFSAAPDASTLGAIQTMVPPSAWAPSAGTPVIGPTVGPVARIRVNGQDGYTATVGVGLTPELSWDPPAVGTPTGYRVEALEAPGFLPVGTVATRQTNAQIPPGLLREGAFYVFRVTAVQDAAATAQRPLAYGFPSGFAANATALMSP